MPIVKTSFKVLLELCTQLVPTPYAPSILSLFGVIKFHSQTVSAIASCILALLDKPAVLKKAQSELDSVLKPGHLPDFNDEPALPYITAIAMEALRWRDVVPIGGLSQTSVFSIYCLIPQLAVPHLLDVEDEYKGYRLPARSIIIPNAWYSMLVLF